MSISEWLPGPIPNPHFEKTESEKEESRLLSYQEDTVEDGFVEFTETIELHKYLDVYRSEV